MRRRFIAVIIGSALAASMLAACGSGSTNDATGTAALGSSTPRPSVTAGLTPNATPSEAAETPTVAAPTQAPQGQATVPPPAPTKAAQPTTAPPPPPPPPPTQPPAAQSRVVVAENIAFDPKQFTAAANVPLTITLDNRDATIAHDIIIYGPDGSKVAETAVITGPATTSTTFTPPAPGIYRFKCSVHPQQMFGAISIQ